MAAPAAAGDSGDSGDTGDPGAPGVAFEQARALFVGGVAAYEAGRFEDAEQLLQRSLALLPGRPSTLVNLGATRLQLGQPQPALDALDAALAAAPGDVDAWCHRGTACGQLGDDGGALHSFQRALALNPRHGAARQCLALTLNRLSRPRDALAALDALLADEPRRASAWLLHGQTLRTLNRHTDALASYQHAVESAPAFGDAWSALGQLLMDMGRAADAAAAFEHALRHGADAPTQRYFLAALQGRGAPAAAPAGYVQALFDSYAGDFDRHLLDVLQYRAHDLVAHAAAAAMAPAATGVSALDLGCGSGLCGPALRTALQRSERSPAVHLTGIDLSPTMLALAHARGAYDALLQGELVQHLQTTAQQPTLVVAADVFIYIGDLAPVFAGVRRVLAPGGVFAFSVERSADAAAPTLQPNLRYAHGEAYLRGLAVQHGLAVAHIGGAVLREDQHRPIDGLIACLRG